MASLREEYCRTPQAPREHSTVCLHYTCCSLQIPPEDQQHQAAGGFKKFPHVQIQHEGGGLLQKEAFEKTALFSIIRDVVAPLKKKKHKHVSKPWLDDTLVHSDRPVEG
ncbi:uncharacterized protein LOC131529986 [Onychostoma macrolepis]|uniref:uncharacterized protein LOC131529986 n=1 Tax=Onychostoma macrolepis TaxID=369639 RepID=UPI00272C9139|nr:uncharacterized protein LOC131529986 [Onychostoma macrolepis]